MTRGVDEGMRDVGDGSKEKDMAVGVDTRRAVRGGENASAEYVLEGCVEVCQVAVDTRVASVES